MSFLVGSGAGPGAALRERLKSLLLSVPIVASPTKTERRRQSGSETRREELVLPLVFGTLWIARGFLYGT